MTAIEIRLITKVLFRMTLFSVCLWLFCDITEKMVALPSPEAFPTSYRCEVPFRNDSSWPDTPARPSFLSSSASAGQPSASFIEPRAFLPTPGTGSLVKLLSLQPRLHTTPPLLSLTNGDTATVDLSQPIKGEVFAFLPPFCSLPTLPPVCSLSLKVAEENSNCDVLNSSSSQIVTRLTIRQDSFGCRLHSVVTWASRLLYYEREEQNKMLLL